MIILLAVLFECKWWFSKILKKQEVSVIHLHVFRFSCYQNMILKPAVATSPGNLAQKQSLNHTPDLLNLKL